MKKLPLKSFDVRELGISEMIQQQGGATVMDIVAGYVAPIAAYATAILAALGGIAYGIYDVFKSKEA